MAKEKKKAQLNMYAQLGAKYNNGRIAKAGRQYDVDYFVNNFITEELEVVRLPKINSFDRIFNTADYKIYLSMRELLKSIEAINQLRASSLRRIVGYIELDDYGVSPKKKYSTLGQRVV